MTTPADFGVFNLLPFLTQVTDKASLQLVDRVMEAQVTVLEAQLNQLRQVKEAVQQRLGQLG
ncbi:MAG: hypothetical protein M3314_13740 [Actinomycetota bacterium]|nr:hypothetical protein [Actinomycetota bacterium]